MQLIRNARVDHLKINCDFECCSLYSIQTIQNKDAEVAGFQLKTNLAKCAQFRCTHNKTERNLFHVRMGQFTMGGISGLHVSYM